MPFAPPQVVIVGAGIAGLAAAIRLAAAGTPVTLLERAGEPGGKVRAIGVGDARIDAGPTVFTMRWVFDELFDEAGATFASHVDLRRAEVLARHAWAAGGRLDLFADLDRSVESISAFAGPAEGRRYRAFAQAAAATFATLDQPFLRAPKPGPLDLAVRLGWRRLPDLWRIRPFATLWKALGEHFRDPRLQQLFGRYATYCGSSPFAAPATLMLVAHVEREGVWLVRGGMHALARALAALAVRLGVRIRYGAEVSEVVIQQGRAAGVRLATGETLDAGAVVVAADVNALATGAFGAGAARAAAPVPAASRSLSALTWCAVARCEGFALSRHNVFFSDDYRAEFDDLFVRRRVPRAPSVYLCAQDRDEDRPVPGDGERLFCIVNAPADGDRHPYDSEEIASCQEATFRLLRRCGLAVTMKSDATRVTTPRDFHRLFPATGGALYGRASHGWQATFRRPGAVSRVPGLYLAGGSTHPGPGVPMAALSGRIAAATMLADFASASAWRPVAMPGGISTR